MFRPKVVFAPLVIVAAIFYMEMPEDIENLKIGKREELEELEELKERRKEIKDSINHDCAVILMLEMKLENNRGKNDRMSQICWEARTLINLDLIEKLAWIIAHKIAYFEHYSEYENSDPRFCYYSTNSDCIVVMGIEVDFIIVMETKYQQTFIEYESKVQGCPELRIDT